MSQIGNLIIETEELGYDTEIMTIAEMLEVRDHGKILDESREAECNIGFMEDQFRQEEAFIVAVKMARTENF